MSGINLDQKIFIDVVIGCSFILFFAIFFRKKVLTSDTWRAIGTPLASIIGSGFLIATPLLWILTGPLSIFVLLIIIFLAYSVGHIIRYNIQHAEPLLDKKYPRLNALNYLSILSETALAAAYFISIVFYIQLLSAFALKSFDITNPFYIKILGTFIILITGIHGKLRGFNFLETIEIYAVNIKIAIILVFITALICYDFTTPATLNHTIVSYDISIDTWRRIGGMFLIIQGFEISKYLGHKYDPDFRVKTMRLAQIISSVIYLVFIYFAANLMTDFKEVSETLIIDVSQQVSIFLPLIITLGALASQYSSSIADMIGCGGIIKNILRKKSTLNTSYLFISFACIICLWSINVFETIALASRAFAFYYFLQSLIAFFVSKEVLHRKNTFWQTYILFIAAVMLAITLFSLPIH